jgi:hypothetical protein
VKEDKKQFSEAIKALSGEAGLWSAANKISIKDI